MSTHQRLARMITPALACGLLGTAAIAGPLDPPGGPITPTMKTLDQVEARIPINAETCPGDADSVFRIAAPGSYYLTGNVFGASGKRGIELAAGDVTIDLNGFRLVGGAGSLDGVTVLGSYRAITIRNGSVSQWGGHGVNLSSAASSHVQDLTVAANGGNGINIGPASSVVDCAALQNTETGISSGAANVLTGCSARLNGDGGIRVDTDSTAENCAASENQGYGLTISNGAMARGCSASDNQGDGFFLNDSAKATECVSSANAGSGIRGSYGAQVTGSSCSFNTLDGITLSSYGIATGNLCRQNGLNGDGAGIRVVANGVRSCVQGNNLVQNDWGIKVDTGFNLIIGNTCTLNTSNFFIEAGNRVGKIVTLPTSGFINGNAGGDSTGVDPISNFAF